MKFARQAIFAVFILGTVSGSALAMFPNQFPNNMGNSGMFGQQPRMYMPQQQQRPMFNMPQTQRPFMQSPMMQGMMNQFGNNGSSFEQRALSSLTNWMMTGQPQYLQSVISNSVRGITNKYYPQKLKNIWWARVVADTVLTRLTTVGIPKLMMWLTSSKKAKTTK